MMDKRGVLLTEEQKALLPIYRDKWLAIGLATGPTDYAAAEQAISEIYRMVGYAPPSEYLHLPSPFHGTLESQICKARQPDWRQIKIYIDRQFEQIDLQIRKQIEQHIRHQIKSQIGLEIFWQIGQEIENQIWRQIVRQNNKDQDKDWFYSFGYSLYNASCIVYYDYLLEVCHIEACKKLEPIIQLAKVAGWWWPYKDVCIITPLHSVLHLDEIGNLHCEDGPALDYDGAWSIYSWHGVSVPRNIIKNPESIVVSDISSERNAEVRRVMIARYGYERYCRDTSARILHRDDWGTLWLVDEMKVVEVVNSTPEPDGTWKHYWLRVPPTMKTAHQAVAWTNYETEGTYDPAIQT